MNSDIRKMTFTPLVTVHCDTELKRNMVMSLLAENAIPLTEELATYYDMDSEKYAITVHPHEDSTSKLDRFLNNARSVKLVDAFYKRAKESRY